MRTFFSALLQSLIGLVTSKKVITAVATAVAGAVIKDPEIAKHVIEVGMVLVAGQGAADWGKNAKKSSEPLFPEQTP